MTVGRHTPPNNNTRLAPGCCCNSNCITQADTCGAGAHKCGMTSNCLSFPLIYTCCICPIGTCGQVWCRGTNTASDVACWPCFCRWGRWHRSGRHRRSSWLQAKGIGCSEDRKLLKLASPFAQTGASPQPCTCRKNQTVAVAPLVSCTQLAQGVCLQINARDTPPAGVKV